MSEVALAMDEEILEFKPEAYGDIIDELRKLLPLHWHELALYQDNIELAPDYEFYANAEKLGMLMIVTARSQYTRAIVGYAIYFVRRNHHHYSKNSWAVSDIFWLHPDLRNFGYGRLLFLAAEAQLKQLGVDVMHTTLKVEHPAAAFVLEALGHTKVELGYSKKLI